MFHGAILMKWIAFLVLLCLPVAVIIWEVSTGNILGRSWQVKFRKSDQPTKYWLIISVQSALVAIFILAIVFAAVFRR
jgi:hypothetical protein